MTDEMYTVKINRREGVVEITGPDKDWIAEQLDRLTVVYGEHPGSPPPPELPAIDTNETVDETGTGAKAKRAKAKTAESDDGPPRRRGRGGGGFRGRRVDELAQKLTPDVCNSLQAYVDERRANFTDGPNQAAILAAFLQTELSWNTVTPNDLYTVYDVMGWPGPNPKSALDNAKSRKNYFTSAGRGSYQLSYSGERFGRHEAKGPAESKTSAEA